MLALKKKPITPDNGKYTIVIKVFWPSKRNLFTLTGLHPLSYRGVTSSQQETDCTFFSSLIACLRVLLAFKKKPIAPTEGKFPQISMELLVFKKKPIPPLQEDKSHGSLVLLALNKKPITPDKNEYSTS
ncbi:hypothetical protein [Marinifilum sp.]|uniref:hypothetical protein n=1 Tax=Marinifilum sp. TaxID=2033137 RepID=UPI003BAC94FC